MLLMRSHSNASKKRAKESARLKFCSWVALAIFLPSIVWAGRTSATATADSYFVISSPAGLSDVVISEILQEKIVAGMAAVTYAPQLKRALAFKVNAGANQAYTLILPKEIALKLANGKERKILLNQFTSFPQPTSGHMDSKGSQLISIGLTREAIPFDLPPGRYVGKVPIAVLY